MPSFLVEGYLSSGEAGGIEALSRTARAAAAARRGRKPIRYLGSLVVPADEVCFHLFEAPSAAALIEASKRARLACERVVETVRIPGSPDEDQ